jgi:hypothetical protein
MPNIKEVRDAGAAPNAPTVAEMRESQRKGSEGIGLNKQSFNDDLRHNNQAPDINSTADEDATPSAGGSPLAWMP